MTKLEAFDLYTKKLKWKVTPIWPDTKRPILNNWNKQYDREKVREIFEQNPALNLGLCLGDFVDVEADTLAGNRKLLGTNSTSSFKDLIPARLSQPIGTIPHPTWKSSRSTHHLFLNPDPKLTKVTLHGVEFRGHAHQSILPPSVVNGVKYRWLNGIFVPPPMPKSLLKFYWKNLRVTVRPGIGRMPLAKIWCGGCGNECKVPEQRLELELKAFDHLKQRWQCRTCRQDIRPVCRKLKWGKSNAESQSPSPAIQIRTT